MREDFRNTLRDFVLPILYGGLGFVATLMGAWLYNVLAGMVGGIELDVQ